MTRHAANLAVIGMCLACSSTATQRTEMVREDATPPESGTDATGSAGAAAEAGVDAASELTGDADGDGFVPPLDCNDNDARVHPDLPPDNWAQFYEEPIEPDQGSDANWDYNCDGKIQRKIEHAVGEYGCDEVPDVEVWDGSSVPWCGETKLAYFGIARGVDGGCTTYDSPRYTVQACK